MANLPVANDFIAPTVTESQFKAALKILVENVASKDIVTNAKSEAIATAASDATTKANTAESNAITAAASDATTKAITAEIKAKQYSDATKTDKNNARAEGDTDIIAVIASSNDKALAHFDTSADFYLAGDVESVQKKLERVPTLTSALKVAHSLDDSNGQSLFTILEDGSAILAGDRASLQQQLGYAKSRSKLASILPSLTTPDKVKLNSVLTAYGDDAETINYSRIDSVSNGATTSLKRIPSIIKTGYGLLFMYCEQIKPYDGDNEGARLCKRYVNLDSTGRIVSVSTKTIVESPSVDTGLVKHQMLGRTATGRIVMIYDVRETTTTPYRNYIRFSDDDGVTFTTATEITRPAGFVGVSVVTGSTGAIATLSTGRLVCPFYYIKSVICAYSDDNGVTWGWGDSLGGGDDLTNESAITVDENDVLYLSVRANNRYNKLIYTSVDGGQTLVSTGLKDDLPSSVCASTILYDKNNGVMFHGTPTNLSGTVRKRYRLKLSLDKAVTFPINVKLFDDELYVGYSNLIPLGGGMFALAYEGDAVAMGVNVNENVSLLIFNLSGVLSNVTYS